jgi:hypothetical protein
MTTKQDGGAGTVRVNWTRWPNLERWLTEVYHVKWIFHERYDLSRVNLRKSRQNQARFDSPLDQERVNQLILQAKMIELDLPALMVYREALMDPAGRGSQDIIGDGNHRDEMARRSGLRYAAAYEIVEAGPQTLNALTKAVNVLTGIGHRPDEVVQHAVAYALLPENANKKASEIAPLFAIGETRLREKISIAKVRVQFSSDGTMPVAAHRRLNDSVVSRLLKITNDRVLHAAAEGLSRFPKMDEKTAKELVSAVLAATPRTQDRQLATLHDQLAALEKEVGPGGKIAQIGKQKTTPQRLLGEVRRLGGSLDQYLPETVNARDVFTADQDRDAAATELTELRKKIGRVLKELTK